MPRYLAFGSQLDANVPMPPFAGADCPGLHESPGITIEVLGPAGLTAPEQGGPFDERRTADGSEVLFRLERGPENEYRFRYADGCELAVAPDGRHIAVAWPEELTLEDAGEYLAGPAIAFALRLQGEVCLHASAVAVDNGSFAILAAAEHGKSTTAAACALLGHPVLTDDVLLLRWSDGHCFAVPAYPRVRLWPRAVEALFGSVDALPLITPDHPAWDKRYLDLTQPGFAFQREPVALTTIYTHAREEAPKATFERVSPADALVTLLANVYSLSKPSRRQRGREFALLDRIARTIPMRRFRGPYGLENVADNCRALVQECRSTTSMPAPVDE